MEMKKRIIKIGLVGALNVGSISLSYEEGKDLNTNQFGLNYRIIKQFPNNTFGVAGEELGNFNLGSTIVMMVETQPNFKWSVNEEDQVRYGQMLGESR